MIEIFPKDIEDERRVSILHREREDIEQIPNLGGGQIVKQVGDLDPPRGNLKKKRMFH